MSIEISCELCRDLMPLVRDGVAGESSREAVEAHLKNCDQCKEIYEAGIPESSGDQALSKAMKRVQTVSAIVAGAAVLLGIFLCELVMQGSSVIFIMAVLLIRGLLRIGFRREKGGLVKKAAALLCAVALIAGVIWSGNELFGNPLTKAKAEAHIQGYLDGAFGDSDYYIEEVLYTWSGSYEGTIRSRSDPELEFYISYRDGEILYDTYREHVLDIWE